MNVLYSFPHRLGAGQICYTAWQQVCQVSPLVQSLTVLCGSVERTVPADVRIVETLKLGPIRVPYRLLGRSNACQLHDYLTARFIRANGSRIDVFHGWPLGSRLSLIAARESGIGTVVERPNAHTGFAFDVVEQECRRIGFSLPPEHEHRPNARTLATEEAEYRAADFLLCPSPFVRKTFLEKGFSDEKLLRHQYGYDPARFCPRATRGPDSANYPTVVFAGVAAPRKGLHIALQAWRDSTIRTRGRFLICGAFISNYAEFLGPLLKLPGVEVLGHRTDLPDILGAADALVLPSFEEGSALVTYEARAAGCLLLVSTAAGAMGNAGVDVLLHEPGDVAALRNHFDQIVNDPASYLRLKEASLRGVNELTWESAGQRLHACYGSALQKRVPSEQRADVRISRTNGVIQTPHNSEP